MSRIRFLTGWLAALAVVFVAYPCWAQEEAAGAATAQEVIDSEGVSKEEDVAEEKTEESKKTEESTGEQEAAKHTRPVRDSVVKIYTIRRGFSLTSPWKRSNSSQVTGSGFVLSSTEILTNYHVVARAADVSISLDGESDRLSGRVKAIAPGLDIALIELEEPLPEDVPALQVAEQTPRPGAKIQVLGLKY